MSKKYREQNKIHPRITVQDGAELSQKEMRQHLTDLFALLFEMYIDQSDVTKECSNEKQAQ